MGLGLSQLIYKEIFQHKKIFVAYSGKYFTKFNCNINLSRTTGTKMIGINAIIASQLLRSFLMESCLFKETNCQPEARKEFGAKMQINEQTLHHGHRKSQKNHNSQLQIDQQ